MPSVEHVLWRLNKSIRFIEKVHLDDLEVLDTLKML